MDTIALFNTKGGVGKSAVAVFLCDFLSSQHDKRVLLVDLDPQQSAAGSLLGLSKLREGFGCSASLPPLMWQATKGSPSHEQALQHVITRPAVVKNRRTNIDYLERVDVLACGREDWHNLNDKILKNLPSHQKRSFDSMLADALEPLQEDYDL
jgi:cellulose biosynthesis protein BcsQ